MKLERRHGIRDTLSDALRKLWRDEAGVTTLEYALVLALVAAACVVCYQGLAGGTASSVSDGDSAFTEIRSGGGVSETSDPGSAGPG